MSANAPTVWHGGTQLASGSIALPLEIRHGRSAAGAQPDAPWCSFTWAEPTVPFQLGDPIQVRLELPTAGTGALWGDAQAWWADIGTTWSGAAIGTSERFTGVVTGMIASEVGGVVDSWEIECTGVQARLGVIPIDISRPAETDIERVEAIAAAAGYDLTVIGSDTVPLLADNINRDALSALHEVCEWSTGLLFQDRGGQVVYGTANHRDGPAQATLPPSAILDGIAWGTTASEVLNHIVVKYGDPETQNTYRDDDSIAQWGFRHVEVSTKLTDAAAANEFGQTLLIRRSSPFWIMPGILVNSSDCTDAEHYEANLLGIGMGVILPVPLEPDTIYPGNVEVWTVEGWVEVWETAYEQQLQIAVTDRQRWGTYALNRWSGQALEDWAFWLANGTWLEQMTHGN